MCELTPLCGKKMFGEKGELLLLFSQEEVPRVDKDDNRNSRKKRRKGKELQGRERGDEPGSPFDDHGEDRRFKAQ